MVRLNVNENGGTFVPGRTYDIRLRLDVLDCWRESHDADGHPTKTVKAIAKEHKVSRAFVHKIVNEFLATGRVECEKEVENRRSASKRQYSKLGIDEWIVLLSLRVEDDQRPLYSYRQCLYEETGVQVGITTIENFFKHALSFRGSLRKTTMVPLDKWTAANIQRYEEFRQHIANLPNPWKFHWLDEKHIVSKEAYNNRVRRCPLTGHVREIPVPGNFRERYNTIAIITCRPQQICPMHYVLGQENGDAASFTAYIEILLGMGWFEEYDVLIMDNAAIHTGGEANIVADLLWETSRVLVLPLPTRAPELNPIELVFHILARRLRSFKYNQQPQQNMRPIPTQVQEIVETIEWETICKCASHCGYL